MNIQSTTVYPDADAAAIKPRLPVYGHPALRILQSNTNGTGLVVVLHHGWFYGPDAIEYYVADTFDEARTFLNALTRTPNHDH